MLQIGGKDSKRHFKIVMGNKEHGLYISSTPSSAAKKAVTKLCAANKTKKVEFYIREITQGSKKKTYGPYNGYIEKLKEPIELKGRIIQYKPVAKLIGKANKKMKGGEEKGLEYSFNNLSNTSEVISGNMLNKSKKMLEESKSELNKAINLQKEKNNLKKQKVLNHEKKFSNSEEANRERNNLQKKLEKAIKIRNDAKIKFQKSKSTYNSLQKNIRIYNYPIQKKE